MFESHAVIKDDWYLQPGKTGLPGEVPEEVFSLAEQMYADLSVGGERD